METKLKTLTFNLRLNDDQRKYLLDNVKHRHYVYNKGIECIRMKRHYDDTKEVTKGEIVRFIHYRYEVGLRNLYYYAYGIPNVVADDLLNLIKVKDNNGATYKKVTQKFKYQKFKSKYGSFGFDSLIKVDGQLINRVLDVGKDYVKIMFTNKCKYKLYIKDDIIPVTVTKDNIRKIFFITREGEFTITFVIEER